jgi:vitamin B12 transporter
MKLRFAAALALVSAALSAFTFAAIPTAVRGTIRDADGAVVPQARVELLRNNQAVMSTRTDELGRYNFSAVPAGSYQLRAEAPGFAPQQSEIVSVLAGGGVVNVDLKLALGKLDQTVVVSATGTHVPESQVGASVAVLTAAEFQDRLDVLEPLEQVAGAQVAQSGRRGAATSLFVRGANSNANKVLLDGVPLNDIGGVVNFGTLATTGIEQVEILRGPNSVLYGPDAMAGVVSLTTRRGETPEPQVSYAFDAGNFATFRHDVALAGVLRRFDYMTEFSRADAANGLPNSTFHNGTYVANFGLAINPGTDLRFTGRYTTAALGQPNTIAFFGIADDSFERDQDAYLSATLENQTSTRWHNLLRYGRTRLRLQDVNPSPTGIPDPGGSGNFFGLPVTIHGANGFTVSGQGILDFAGTYPFASSSSTTRDAIYLQSDYALSPRLLSLGAFRFEKEDGFTLGFGTKTPASRKNFSYIAELHGSVGKRLYATLGGSVEKNTVFGTTALPRASLSYSLLPQRSGGLLNGTRLKFNYGQGIRGPSIFEATSSLFGLLSAPGGAPQLITQFNIAPIAAERSRSYDAGVEQLAFNDRVKLSATFFHNQFTNQIEFVPSTALPLLAVPQSVINASGFGATINSGDTRALGGEFEVRAALGHGFSVRANYTYLDAVVERSFTSDASSCAVAGLQAFCAINPAFPGIPIGAFAPLQGARPFRRAPHSGSFTLDYTRSRLNVALSGYLVSRRDDSTFLSDANFGPTLLLPNRNLAPAMQKIDLAGSYRVNRHLTFYSVLENLASGHYQPVFGFPALPLTIRSGFRVTMGGERGQ